MKCNRTTEAQHSTNTGGWVRALLGVRQFSGAWALGLMLGWPTSGPLVASGSLGILPFGCMGSMLGLHPSSSRAPIQLPSGFVASIFLTGAAVGELLYFSLCALAPYPYLLSYFLPFLLFFFFLLNLQLWLYHITHEFV